MSCSTQIIGDAELVPDAQDVAREVLALLAVEAGGGLVEQQHLAAPWRARARSRRSSARRRAGRRPRVPVALELDEIEDLLDAPPVRRLRCAHAGQVRALRPSRLVRSVAWRATSRFSTTLMCGEELAVLEGAGDARARDRVRRASGEIDAVEADRARRGPVEPADAVEHDVLPAPFGPIRASSSPARASNDTSRSTCSPPNDERNAARASAASAIPAAAAAVLLDVAVAAAPLAARRRGRTRGCPGARAAARACRRARCGRSRSRRHGRPCRARPARSARRAAASVPSCSRTARSRGHQVLDHERREPERQLVDQQELRRAHQRRADAEHLPLAAGQVAGVAPAQARERRESTRRPRPSAKRAAAPRHRGLEVLVHASGSRTPCCARGPARCRAR